MIIKIWMIRHGMTAGNREQRYVGTTDEPLCEEGRQQILVKGQMIALDYDIQNIYVSPMRRCRETAAILYPWSGQTVIDDFRECSFGTFEYRNYQELNGNPDYQAWIDSNGTLPFPDGESQESFKKRSTVGFKRCIEQCLKEEIKEAAFVVHGGTIMSILSSLATEEKDYFYWQVKNAEGFLVEVTKEEWENTRKVTVIKEINGKE